jgi:hypothetical protein
MRLADGVIDFMQNLSFITLNAGNVQYHQWLPLRIEQVALRLAGKVRPSVADDAAIRHGAQAIDGSGIGLVESGQDLSEIRPLPELGFLLEPNSRVPMSVDFPAFVSPYMAATNVVHSVCRRRFCMSVSSLVLAWESNDRLKERISDISSPDVEELK